MGIALMMCWWMSMLQGKPLAIDCRSPKERDMDKKPNH